MFDINFELATLQIRVAIRVSGIALGFTKDSSIDGSFAFFSSCMRK
jgi:hypothetical protein